MGDGLARSPHRYQGGRVVLNLSKGAACPSTAYGLAVLMMTAHKEQLVMSSTKVKTRGWPLKKFTAAVVRRSKKLGVTIKSNLVKKAYENGLTVKAAVGTSKPNKAA